jgi:hypothetical protein
LADRGQAFVLDEITFFSGDAEIDSLVLHEAGQLGQTRGRHGLGEGVDRIASGEGKEFRFRGGLMQRRHQGMFPSAFPNHQNSHAVM